jgi:RimJ/RimL family protein N-acetyltransferase
MSGATDKALLRGKLVRLRALEREDLPLTHEWANDPRLAFIDANHFPVSMAQEESWFDEVMQNKNRNVLIVEFLEDQAPVGFIYFDTDYVHRSANISINISPDFQGRGMGTDALLTAIHHAFAFMGLNRLGATIFLNNDKSLKLFERCGFRREGVLRQSYIWYGAPQDRVIMSILKDEYLT